MGIFTNELKKYLTTCKKAEHTISGSGQKHGVTFVLLINSQPKNVFNQKYLLIDAVVKIFHCKSKKILTKCGFKKSVYCALLLQIYCWATATTDIRFCCTHVVKLCQCILPMWINLLQTNSTCAVSFPWSLLHILLTPLLGLFPILSA